ncbi:hypothetical protein TNCV_4624231 [Trichonephila clavipes]|nr:hypothetical protein TNCV_4624231 [Trichonephila clavipes]
MGHELSHGLEARVSRVRTFQSLKALRVERLIHVKSVQTQSPRIDMVGKFGGRVVIVTYPWFKITRSVANFPRVVS